MSTLSSLSQEERYSRVPWRSPQASFTWHQSSVRDALKDFAVSQQLVLSISDSVKGVISGVFEDVEVPILLNSICEAHDLIWFYDGVRMNIESANEIV